MVLWEITLTTAYFLGLRRTYHLVLKLQRRLLKNSPTTRGFVRRRTRGVFQLALGAIKGIQERDISLGRNIGNRVLRFLDRLKPSAQIRKDHKIECKGSSAGLHQGSPAAVASKEGSLPHHKAPDVGIRSGVTENHVRSSVASRSSALPSAHVGGLKIGGEIGQTRSQQLQQQQRSLPTMALAGARRTMHDELLEKCGPAFILALSCTYDGRCLACAATSEPCHLGQGLGQPSNQTASGEERHFKADELTWTHKLHIEAPSRYLLCYWMCGLEASWAIQQPKQDCLAADISILKRRDNGGEK
eukprot:SM000388S14665  [mRNA]  locus=s388:36563:39235:+ [translate_table: standard]